MSYKTEPVTVEVDTSGDETHKHPSFSVITLSRRHGGHRPMFGSEIQHSEVVSLSIHRAENKWHLSQWWPFARAKLVEVEMTPDQWARVVSSIGLGGGTPCTMTSLMGEQVPQQPYKEELLKRHKDDIKATAKEAIAAVKDAMALIDGLVEAKKLAKANADIVRSRIGRVESCLAASIPFIMDQAEEMMESTVSKAKMTVEAYTHQMITEAGLSQLKSPISLEHKEAPAMVTVKEQEEK